MLRRNISYIYKKTWDVILQNISEIEGTLFSSVWKFLEFEDWDSTALFKHPGKKHNDTVYNEVNFATKASFFAMYDGWV